MTATQFIYFAERLIGQIRRPGQGPSAAELADGLATLNALLASWSTELLNVFTFRIDPYTLTSGVQSYQIGPGVAGPGFNTARPIRIENAGILVPDGGQAGTKLRWPLELIRQKQWSEIVAKSVSATVPEQLYYDHAGPIGVLYLWPSPVYAGIAEQIELATWQALASFPDLVTDEPMPPGYDRAVLYNLAIDLAPAFGKVPSPAVIEVARESKAALRALNASMMEPDSEPPSGMVNALPEAA